MEIGGGDIVSWSKPTCKPKAPIIASPQIQPRHDRIQVDELSVTAGVPLKDDLLVQEQLFCDAIRGGTIPPVPWRRRTNMRGSQLVRCRLLLKGGPRFLQPSVLFQIRTRWLILWRSQADNAALYGAGFFSAIGERQNLQRQRWIMPLM